MNQWYPIRHWFFDEIYKMRYLLLLLLLLLLLVLFLVFLLFMVILIVAIVVKFMFSCVKIAVDNSSIFITVW